MKISIALNERSYTPEAYAYQRFLEARNWEVQLDFSQNLDKSANLHLYFAGMRTRQVMARSTVPEVHEYHSLSIPPFAKIKNFAKRILNGAPCGRIFLNDKVAAGLSFQDAIPSIRREMGVDKEIFLKSPKNPNFDIVYCGSFARRSGLNRELVRLAEMGLKLLVVGFVDQKTRDCFGKFENVVFTGRVQRHELPSIYSDARCGLNYTPDIYPFNIQTSTKTLEYCAAGLGVISNRYRWAQDFSNQRKSNFLWLENLKSRRDFDSFSFTHTNVVDLEWGRILKDANFVKFLEVCVARNLYC